MNWNDFIINIVTSLIGTFSGAILAFVSALKLNAISKKKKYKKDVEVLLFRIYENNKIFDKIKTQCNLEKDNLQIYEAVFGRYNKEYKLYSVYQIFLDVQTELYKNYRNKHNIMISDDASTNLYDVLKNIVHLQTLVVRMQDNPEKEAETKKKIVSDFNKFFCNYSREYQKISHHKTNEMLYKIFNVRL